MTDSHACEPLARVGDGKYVADRPGRSDVDAIEGGVLDIRVQRRDVDRDLAVVAQVGVPPVRGVGRLDRKVAVSDNVGWTVNHRCTRGERERSRGYEEGEDQGGWIVDIVFTGESEPYRLIYVSLVGIINTKEIIMKR